MTEKDDDERRRCGLPSEVSSAEALCEATTSEFWRLQQAEVCMRVRHELPPGGRQPDVTRDGEFTDDRRFAKGRGSEPATFRALEDFPD